MKKVCFLVFICCMLVLYKLYTPRFRLPVSLAEREIAITFLDEDVLLYSSKQARFLLNLKNAKIDKYIRKYHLKGIPIFTPATISNVDGVDVGQNGMIKITNDTQSFCIMGTDSCNFNYVYEKKGYLESEVYFYHNQTEAYVGNVSNEKYNVSNHTITILFDEESYMVIE